MCKGHCHELVLVDAMASLNRQHSYHIVGQQDFQQFCRQCVIAEVPPQRTNTQEASLKREKDAKDRKRRLPGSDRPSGP